MNKIKWTWQCDSCKDIVISYSDKRHDMNVCECGKSGVDLEEHYARGMGEYTVIRIDKEVSGKWQPIK